MKTLKKLVYICDWLPPDFGAVGQYAMLEAREWAMEGWAVTLFGLTSGKTVRDAEQVVGRGKLAVVRLHRSAYQKQKFLSRMIWTLLSNLLLLGASLKALWQADAILFTGSPPLMLHFVAPLNVILGKHLIYRIMDFHPECSIAERGGRAGLFLGMLMRLTHFWRRRVDTFEVLGEDQATRLIAGGISKQRIILKRNPSPVVFSSGIAPMPLPTELRGGAGVILYSGNWGVAHDESTFVEGYAKYFLESTNPFRFWLNATGTKSDRVESELRALGIPIYRSRLMPLDELPHALIAVDVHLVTLRDEFVGYVLPSKIHACIESGKRIVFIGSAHSDVHILASRLGSERYRRVNVGDVDAFVQVLCSLEQSISTERSEKVGVRDGQREQ